MMTKRAGILALLIIAVAVFWMRPEKRVGRNADAGSFILRAHAQTANYGGATSVGSFSANCIPVAPTATTLNCSAWSDNATNLTATEAILAPVGSGTLPGYAFSGGANQNAAGMYWTSASTSILNTNGVVGWLSVGVGATGIQIRSDAAYGWNSSTVVNGASMDAGFRRRGAANISLGFAADVNGVPVAQTLGVQGAVTGTDLPGSLFSLVGSLGTGAGLPAPVSIKGADQSVATGATAQTGIHRLVVGDTKNLTTASATTVLSIPLATLQMAGGTITYHMEATDGTNQCTRDGVMTFSAENSAGVFVTNLTNSAGANDSTACTATKTLTEAWTVTSANPALVQVTPTLTGITATRFSLNYSVVYGGNTQPTL